MHPIDPHQKLGHYDLFLAHFVSFGINAKEDMQSRIVRPMLSSAAAKPFICQMPNELRST